MPAGKRTGRAEQDDERRADGDLSVSSAIATPPAVLRDVFERSAVGVAVVAPDGRCLHANDALCDLSGYTRDELSGAPISGLAQPSAGAEIEAARVAMLEGSVDSDIREALLRRKDGSTQWVRVIVSLVRDDEGVPQHFVSQLVDIGELRASEEALVRAQRVAGLGSWEWDVTTDRVTWSDSLYRIVGLDTAARDASFAASVELIHEADRPLVEAAVARVRSGAEDGFREVVRLVREDGTICMLEATAVAKRDSDGRLVLLSGVARDITAEREKDAEVSKLREELAEAHRLEAVGRLAGGIAHKINNALTAISGYAELALSDLEPTSAARRDVETLRAVARDAASLPRQLLAFARRQSLRPRNVDIEALVVDGEPLLRQVLGPECTLRRDPTTTGVRASVDPGQLQVVLVNLALNAKEAMPHGGVVTIATDRRTVAADQADHLGLAAGVYASLTVSDTGRGMDEATRRRAVEPFFSTKPEAEHAGLGLAAVYGVVRQSGGAVVIDSDPGGGTRVEVLIPAATVGERSERAAAPPAETTVLVVEDQDAVREIAERSLRAAGYTVVAAASATEAHAAAEQRDVDLLVADVRLADGESGIDLARGLRERQSTLPVVLISGYSDVEPAPGDHVFLPKPFSPDDLRAAAAAALGRPEEPVGGGTHASSRRSAGGL